MLKATERKGLALLLAATIAANSFVAPVGADSIERLELADWDQLLNKEGWQVFLASPSLTGIGLFVREPERHDATDFEFEVGGKPSESLKKCGVSLVEVQRVNFSSPHVPFEVVISRPESITMSGALEAFFEDNPAVSSISATLEGSVWNRILTSDTTATLHSSAAWADPNIRAAIIACVQEHGELVAESELISNVIFQFFDSNNFVMPISQLSVDTSRGSLFRSAMEVSPFHLRNTGVSLARRRGLCVNDAIFFTNPEGEVGGEECK